MSSSTNGRLPGDPVDFDSQTGGTVLKDRLTLSGKTVTEVESVKPAESVTVKTIS